MGNGYKAQSTLQHASISRVLNCGRSSSPFTLPHRFALYMMYFPSHKKVNTLRYKLRLLCLPARSFAWSISLFFAKIIAGNFVVSAIITTILLAFVRDTTDHHSIWTLLWAGFLGITSVFLTTIQYIPQIIETYLRKVKRKRGLECWIALLLSLNPLDRKLSDRKHSCPNSYRAHFLK
jgi:hypothetical protein